MYVYSFHGYSRAFFTGHCVNAHGHAQYAAQRMHNVTANNGQRVYDFPRTARNEVETVSADSFSSRFGFQGALRLD